MDAEALAPTNDAAAPVAVPDAPADKQVDPESRDYTPKDDIRESLAKIWRDHNKPTEIERVDRAPDGRFLPKDKPAESPVDQAQAQSPPAETSAPAAPDGKQEATQEPPAKPAIEPPRAWKQELKEAFGKIDPRLQEQITHSEAELQKLRSAEGRASAEFAPYRDVLAKNNDYLMRASGGNVPAFLDRVIEFARGFDTNPAEAIKHLAKLGNVDLGEIWDPSSPPMPAEAFAAQQRAQQAEMQLEMMRQQQEAAARAAASQSVAQAVEAFWTENPDALSLEAEMATYAPAIQKTNPNMPLPEVLKRAYEAAAWANPEFRARKIAAEAEAKAKAAEAERIAAAKAAASKASASARVNVSGSVERGAKPDYDTDLRAIWRKNNAA